MSSGAEGLQLHPCDLPPAQHLSAGCSQLRYPRACHVLLSAASVRVVCRCRPVRSELLRGHGQGGSDARTEDAAAGKAGKVSVKKPPTGREKRQSTQLSTQQMHNIDNLGIKFGPDGKSITVLEQASVSPADSSDAELQLSLPDSGADHALLGCAALLP